MTGTTPAATFSYKPGPHTAIVVSPVAVLVALPMSSDIVPRLYNALVKDTTTETALDVLASSGISHMPSFGILAPAPEETRLVVRGEVTGQQADGQIRSKGLFTDTTVPPDATIALISTVAGDDDGRPIRDGIVAAGRIDIGWPARVQTPPPAQPAARGRRVAKPAAEPEPSPGPQAATPPTSEPAPEPAPADATSFDHLFGSTTMLDSMEVPPPPPPPPEPEAPSLGATQYSPPTMQLDDAGDPGQVMFSDSGKPFIDSFDWMGPADQPPPPPPPEPAPLDMPPPPPPEPEDMAGHTIRRSSESKSGEQVAAVRCPYGHLNPPFAEYCRVCQQPISPQDPITVTRPSLGHLRLSNGLVLTLDRGVVLGRNPHAVAGAPGPQPNLVRLNDPNKDISSQHLEVRLDGWFVTVRDLKSTNGTQVLLPGQPPITLRADEPMTIGPGAKVVLADVFDFVFEADQ